MKKITFITGPVRSGKSSFAVELAKKTGKKVVFMATCQPLDKEMEERIRNHRKDRPSSWEVIEEPVSIAAKLDKITGKTVIIDCLTLWISNMLVNKTSKHKIFNEIENFIEIMKKNKTNVIIVSNEVGWGIVPDNRLSRDFRDITGVLHRKIAAASNAVFLVVAGIPVKMK